MLKRENKQTNLLEYISVVVALIVGFIARIPGYVHETFAYTYDVGRDLLKVREIITTLDVPLIGQTTGLPGLFYGPWWYYVLTIPYIVSQGDPRGVLLFMIATGLISIFIAYAIGRSLKAPALGMLFAVCVSVSPELRGLSSQIWNPYIIPLYVLLFIFTVIYATQRRRQFLTYVMAGFLSGLIVDSEIVYGVLFIAGVLVSLLIYRQYVTRTMLFGGVLGFFIILLPRIIFEIRHGFIMTRAVLTFIATGRDGSGAGLQFQPINSVTAHWHMLINTIAGNSSLLSIILCAVIIAVFFKYWRFLSKPVQVIILFFSIQIAVSIAGLSFFFEEIWPHYMAGDPIMYAGIFSVAAYVLYMFDIRHRVWIAGLLIAVMLYNAQIPGLVKSLSERPAYTDPAAYGLARQVVDTVYEDAAGAPFKYIVYTPPVHDFTYEYLFSWYGEKTYGYTPVESSDLFYVIIEPDRERPERLVEWLAVRESDGTIIEEKDMPGGIMIQKRYVSENIQ